MDINTIKILNNLNNNFYKITATDFDSSRQYFWQGWEYLLKYLEHFNQLKLIDLGCGNARFYKFLKENITKNDISYLGIDSNQSLLDFAKETADNDMFNIDNTVNVDNNGNNDSYKQELLLQKTDIISALINKENHIKDTNIDVIVSFGVFHHIPSFKLRVQLLKYLKSKINNNGYIIISLWQFMDYERFRKKIVTDSITDIVADNEPKETLNAIELEKNDYILDWNRGERALRYCHFIDQDEQKELIRDSGLELVDSFRADGKEKNVNQYLVLKANKTR